MHHPQDDHRQFGTLHRFDEDEDTGDEDQDGGYPEEGSYGTIATSRHQYYQLVDAAQYQHGTQDIHQPFDEHVRTQDEGQSEDDTAQTYQREGRLCAADDIPVSICNRIITSMSAGIPIRYQGDDAR